MNAQLAGKGDTRIGATSIGVGVRRILTLSILLFATMIALFYGMNQNDGKITPVWLAITMLVLWRQQSLHTVASWVHLGTCCL